MLNEFALIKPVVFTYPNNEETITKLEARGVNYETTNNGLVVLDKKGLPSILLNTLAGTSISRSVISGSIAEGEGFEVGSVYVANIQEKKANDYGRQFSFVNCGVVKPYEVAKAAKDMGKARIIDVSDAPDAAAIEVEGEEVEQFG